MRHVLLLITSLFFSSFAMAQSAADADFSESVDFRTTVHRAILLGLQPGEGRIIRSDYFRNNKFSDGYFFCAGPNALLAEFSYSSPKLSMPYHEEHVIKFSICQDETLAECQEFATDKFLTFINAEGYFEHDSLSATIDVAPIKAAYQSCEPNAQQEELVRKSLHQSDRRFAHIG